MIGGRGWECIVIGIMEEDGGKDGFWVEGVRRYSVSIRDEVGFDVEIGRIDGRRGVREELGIFGVWWGWVDVEVDGSKGFGVEVR